MICLDRQWGVVTSINQQKLAVLLAVDRGRSALSEILHCATRTQITAHSLDESDDNGVSMQSMLSLLLLLRLSDNSAWKYEHYWHIFSCHSLTLCVHTVWTTVMLCLIYTFCSDCVNSNLVNCHFFKNPLYIWTLILVLPKRVKILAFTAGGSFTVPYWPAFDLISAETDFSVLCVLHVHSTLFINEYLIPLISLVLWHPHQHTVLFINTLCPYQ